MKRVDLSTVFVGQISAPSSLLHTWMSHPRVHAFALPKPPWTAIDFFTKDSFCYSLLLVNLKDSLSQRRPLLQRRMQLEKLIMLSTSEFKELKQSEIRVQNFYNLRPWNTRATVRSFCTSWIEGIRALLSSFCRRCHRFSPPHGASNNATFYRSTVNGHCFWE